MSDKARNETDAILKQMEKHIYKIYSDAADDISKKWYRYMQSHESTLKAKYSALQEANKSGDKDAIKHAKEEYERAVKNITLNNDRYNAMLNETTAKLAHVNEVSLEYVNGRIPKVYTLNYNEFANQDIDGYTFTLVNEQAVRELSTKDKSLLPKRKLDIQKDKEWNQKQINSQVLQGILQGENITKIASRLATVTDMNRFSAIRNARTMVTGAENKGRQDSFEKAQSDGIIMEREWIATNDDRTREAHAELDGITVGVDEPWENEYGEIMYPGDPSADPANVYNCRCSIRARVKGFKWNKEEVEEEAKEEIKEEIKEEAKEEISEEKPMDYEEISERYNIISGNHGKEKIYPREQKAIEDSINFMQSNFGDISDVVETIQVRKSILGQSNVGGLYDKKGEYYKKPNTVYVQRLADPSILVHEMTHAVSSEIAEYYDKFGYESRNKFMDAMEKEAYGLMGNEVPKRTRDLLHYDRRNSDEYFSVTCEGDFGSRNNTNYHESEALIVLKKYWKAIR